MATATSELSILVRLRDEASGAMQRLGVGFDKAVTASRYFAGGLLAGGTAVAGLGGIAIKAAADAEQTKIAFTTMLGSGEKAASFVKDLTQFAKKTPFELKGLEDASKKLLAFGIVPERVLPDLKALGDIAAGVGTEKLPFLITAFGQVQAKGRLMGQELLQFSESGVPLLGELAGMFGKTTAEVQEMITAGEVGFGDVRKALENMSGEGGRFNNLMDQQSKSLNGMISNLKDAWNIFLRGEGQQLLEWGKKFVEIAIDIVQNHLPKWIEKVKDIIGWFKDNKAALLIVAGAITGALIPAILSAVASFAALALSLAPFIIGGAIIGGIVAGVIWIIKHWDLIKEKTEKIWGSIKDFISDIWNGIKRIFEESVSWVMDKLQPFFSAVEKVRSVGNTIGGGISSAFSNIKGAIGVDDAIITPSGQIIRTNPRDFLIATQNPAALGGGGGVTVNLYGDFYTDQEVAMRWAGEIAKEIKRHIKV